MNVNELRNERVKLVNEARSILDAAGVNSLPADTQEKYDRIDNQIDALNLRIQQEEKLNGVESELRNSAYNPVKPAVDMEQRTVKGVDTEEYRKAVNSYLRKGLAGLDSGELRKMSEGTTTEGGFTVPTLVGGQIVKRAYDYNIMRGLATVIQASTNLNIPVVTTHGVASYIAEEGAYADTTEVFGQASFNAYKLSRMLKISEELLNDSAFDLEAYLIQNFGFAFGCGEEIGFIAGTGTGQPTGIVNSASAGITTASPTAIASDEVFDMFHSLRIPYRKTSSWIFGDDTIKVLRKLKNTYNDYLWQPGMATGTPDTLLGRPVYASSNMPAFAATAKVGVFGDMSYYWIVDRTGPAIQRLVELYSANGQIGFRGFMRNDGKLTLTEAVKTLTMHA